MPDQPYLLGIDQGTSGSRALVLDQAGQVRGYGYRPLARHYPHPDWAEQEPAAVSSGVAAAISEALERAGCGPAEIAACGIACQRNTDFVWSARTGQPLANAIIWQDLRTVPMLEELAAVIPPAEQRRRLGYFPGPYSSALHLAWRMRHDPAVISAAQAGDLRIGFSAAWLLTDLGRPSGHHMDYGLVQQTGLYDFQAQSYWPEWLELLNVSLAALPTAAPTVHPFGTLRLSGGEVPVLAMIGNEQAALFGHHCHTAGSAECSHGTASFINVCLGDQTPTSDKLNIYFAWSLAGEPLTINNEQLVIHNSQSKVVHTYCLEADTTVSGAAIRWMRDEARLFDRDEEVGPLAESVPDSAGVVFVPAFTGLNVPTNDRSARGTIFGLTLGSSRAHIVRAFLESLGYQMRAIVATIEAETGLHIERLSVGGGIAASDIACQIQADLLGIPLVRPAFTENAARAAALLAGLGSGVWASLADLPPLPGGQTVFEPKLPAEQRDAGYARWQQAIERARGWSEL